MTEDEIQRQIDFDGMVEKILFKNDKGDYSVAIVIDLENDRPCKVVGPLGALKESTPVRIRGLIEHHPKYGVQIRATRVVPALPASLLGIERFLASGAVKGIGPVLAERLVEKFGTDTLQVIEKTPQRLAEIDGVGEKRILGIRKSWDETKAIRDSLIFLHGLGIGPGFAARIHKAYGDATETRVREQPYRLIREVHGIGFRLADRIAIALGLPHDSIERMSAGAHHTLQTAAESGGHCCLPKTVLLAQLTRLLEASEEIASTGIDDGLRNGHLVAETFPEATDPLIYLHGIHWIETSAAERFAQLIGAIRSGPRFDVASSTAWAEALLNIKLSVGQRNAVAAALTEKVVVITGGPGVGKTTVVRSICTILEAKDHKIALAAPTGRAAKRLQETTQRPAKTLHRLLKYDPKKNAFTVDRDRPLPVDTVIVDESSMLDIALFQALLEGLRPDTALVLVGDIDQLPSVGAGRVLTDLIQSNVVRVIRLDRIFRQQETSRIVLNAHRVNQGLMPELAPRETSSRSDFFFVPCDDPVTILAHLGTLVVERIPKAFGLDPMRDIQVLTPMHKGACGDLNLNVHLKKLLNPGSPKVSLATEEEGTDNTPPRFDPGDKVMQIRNNYDKEVFNGDIGTVVGFSAESRRYRVSFDGKELVYSGEEIEEIVAAYAITVHKSQGSEYPCVVMPLALEHSIMLQRNLLYTAITRAKKLVVLIGSKRALAMAIQNHRSQRRYSGLASRLVASSVRIESSSK